MSAYTLLQKIKYRLKAKNRHGVHSPFVFDFVEKIVNGKFKAESKVTIQKDIADHLSKKQLKILTAIAGYYPVSAIIFKDHLQELPASEKVILYIFLNGGKMDVTFNTKNIVVILNIHNNKENFRAWEKACGQPEVSLSIDLYDLGLLFFRSDFKVKQHFILQ